MNKLLHPRSLSVQLLLGAALSLIAAVFAFAIFYFLGNELLDHTVYGESFAERMSERQFDRLQTYVLQESITTEKLHRLNAWCSRGRGVYLTVYRNGTLIYESPVAKAQTLDPEAFDPLEENSKREYELAFADGTKAQAFLYYFAADAFYFWMIGVSGLLAFAVFSFCFIVLVSRKVRYIHQLKKELDILAGGDMEYQVTVKGYDELGQLASGIDEMRRSILTHRQSEEEIRSANSHLVTAMSHDLRTPLTSLLAYLEILDREKEKDAEQRKYLIRQSLSKTMTIKSMADKLFEYFLVYTSEWEEPEQELRDADELLEQFWLEYAFSLESQGFAVSTDFRPLGASIEVNLPLLRRAFDNLYANLVKYADPAQTIRIGCRRENGMVLLTLKNAVSPQRESKESTNIGLNTCRRIFRMHGGSFDTAETEGVFRVEVGFPVR